MVSIEVPQKHQFRRWKPLLRFICNPTKMFHKSSCLHVAIMGSVDADVDTAMRAQVDVYHKEGKGRVLQTAQTATANIRPNEQANSGFGFEGFFKHKARIMQVAGIGRTDYLRLRQKQHCWPCRFKMVVNGIEVYMESADVSELDLKR